MILPITRKGRDTKKDASALCGQILDTIANNNGYGVPPGFIDEPYDTALHQALRSLRTEGKIVKADSLLPNESHAALLHSLGQEIWVAAP